jgi:hypothetical protein
MQLFANNTSTTLNGSVASGDLSLVVTATTNFPVISNVGDYFYSTIANSSNTTWEIVQVTATSGTTFTIVRAQDNTTALTWPSGSIFEMRNNAQILRDILAAATIDIDCGDPAVAPGALTIDCGVL